MSNFLGALSSQINTQYDLNSVNNTASDIGVFGGKISPGNVAGDFTSQFDQFTERKYLEEGYLRNDPYTTSSKEFNVLFQEPNATILVKKKMFSSIADNFRPDYMTSDEKLYYKTMKVLFQNKCTQISALEKLSKIQKITSIIGNVSNQLVPMIIGLADQLNSSSGINTPGAFGTGGPLNSQTSAFSSIVDRLRKVYGFNTTNPTTTWITDSTSMFPSRLGQGTGVIEITNFKSIDTTTTTSIDTPGMFSISIEDPYQAMLITDWDIEKAISDATNAFYNTKGFQLLQQTLTNTIISLTSQLNQMRAQRNVSAITFQPQSTILSNNPVIAILDKLGTQIPFIYDLLSVSVPPEFFLGGATLGPSGLNAIELSLFSQIISNIFSQAQQNASAQIGFQQDNGLYNYVRSKLRFNFSGKLIIQPMDIVHIYIGSKTRYDSRLMSGINGMFSGLGTLQNLNNSISGTDNSIGTLLAPSGNIQFQVEKAAYAGADFPNALWGLLRDQFVAEKEGTHVFAGLVESAPYSWSAESLFTVQVSGKDNSLYFEQGKVNFKPGADTFSGSFFDPLTPFESNFNSINTSTNTNSPTLLQENKDILGLVKNKLGRYAGQPLTEQNVIQDHTVDPTSGNIIKTFYAPDGLVYKWKEGIGVFTQEGSNLFMNDPSKVGNPNIFVEPFAGQDVMNVISLLITGKPYNFATYFKSTQNLSNYSGDPQSRQNAAHSFIGSLSNQLSISNTLWGNFIPFKSLVVDEASYSKMLSGQIAVAKQNVTLNTQIQKLQQLNEQAMVLGAANILSTTNKANTPQFADLSKQIAVLQEQITSTNNSNTISNMSFNGAALNNNSNEASDLISNNSSDRDVRRQINFLTRRMSYDVRANQDKNLFIVDDSYDKDFDIMAYNQKLDSIKLYNNEFSSVKEKISTTAQLLNLEVFADTQGHIRVRVPQYNRMPSSVFYRMMYLKQALNIQVFPNFLNDLFTSKLNSLRNQLEVLEDQIRLDCAILGQNDGGQTNNKEDAFIKSNATPGSGAAFNFLSSPDGNIVDINAAINIANPGQQNQGQSLITEVNQQAISNNTVITNTQAYTAIINALKPAASVGLSNDGIPVASTAQILSSSWVNTLVNRIQIKSGSQINTKDYLVASTAQIVGVQLPSNGVIDVFKIIQELSDKLFARQRLIKLFASTIKNAQEATSLNGTTTSNNLLNNGGFANSNIPEVFEHMIEDEEYDDYGINSGTRYVIKNNQILNMTISENAPLWTSIQVQGIISDFNIPGPAGFTPFIGNGNGMTTALAIDYDMWRNYGFKDTPPITVPFLHDAVSQCGPYASMLLSRNRKNILRGTITIIGNEYMQPGEIIFIEDKGLLFYVSSVRHSLNLPNNFSTTLELTYGHSPGDYIPTVMDTIGKLLYNNKDTAEFTVQRQETSGNEQSIGALQLSNNSDVSLSSGSSANTPPGAVPASNQQIINNLLFTTAYQINANNSIGNNSQASIELRIYYDNNTPINSDLQNFANTVRSQLIGQGTSGINNITSTSSGSTSISFSASEVSVVSINLNDTTSRKSPSQKGIDMARNLVASRSTNNSNADPIRLSLFANIVDCWIVISQASSTQSSSATSSSSTTEAPTSINTTGNNNSGNAIA